MGIKQESRITEGSLKPQGKMFMTATEYQAEKALRQGFKPNEPQKPIIVDAKPIREAIKETTTKTDDEALVALKSLVEALESKSDTFIKLAMDNAKATLIKHG